MGFLPGTEPSQVEITFPVCARETQRYITRGKRYNAIIDTLQDIENRQKNLYVAKLQTSEDTDKFIAEMRLIQDALDEVDALQKNEGDTLSKKYKASVDYFKKGILRDKIAKLASSQKKLLQVLNNQNEVAYKQSRRSNANNGKKSSSLFCSNTSPGRNQISALCTVNEGLCANHTNGSTMATMVPAACITPDSMSPAFQHSFMRYVGSPEVCSIEDVPGTRLASERREENSSSELILRGKPRRTENVLLRSDLCSGIAPADLHDKINDHLEFSAPGNNSSNSISVKSILNITDTSNNIVGMDHQMSLASKQISPAGPYLQLNTFDETSQGNTTSASVISDRTSNVGNTQQLFVSQGHSSPAESHSPDQNSAGPSANRQLSGRAERKIKRVQMKELIKTGKIKPGKDVLEFQLQGCSHKASLLLDGRIRACSGVNYRDPVQWVKALLGNDIPISWKYVINKLGDLSPLIMGTVTMLIKFNRSKYLLLC
ncbi:ankyrin repeat domain-containing protein 31 [Spea bombifrons]|uniref:ankyrin repeat domain-containing protein 31 n=1 Tax=Spea bombifrons TaxID=233779 RepID=UPI00234BC182|nr:ankyrin repeat domain-containing protein 31 [Spea bombifrons]